MGSPKRILIIQLRQLGDILLTTPCIRELARAGHQVDFLAHKMGRKVLAGNNFLHNAHYYREEDPLTQKLGLVRELRGRGYDCVFDFMNNPRSALYAVLSGASQRWAFHSSRRFAYTDTIPAPGSDCYIVESKFTLLRAAGFAATDVALDLPCSDRDRGAARAFASMRIRVDAPLVFLSPTHRRSRRKWPRERWIALAEWLRDEKGAEVCWVWGPGEQEEVAELAAATREGSLVAPPSTFKELAVLFRTGKLFIGNSNGPSHVAVAAGLASIQLHGHTDARSWCPKHPLHSAIQSSAWQSDPNHAMEAITLDQVKAAVTARW